MFEKFKKLEKKYRASEEVSREIHNKNRFHMKFVFGFSTLFGIVTILATILGTKSGELNKSLILYYLFYIVVGVIGLVLTFTKSGRYTPSIALLIFFGASFSYYILTRPLYLALFYYLTFLFFLIIFFDFNPFVLTYSLLGLHLLLVLLLALLPSYSNHIYSKTWLNIVMVNACLIYLSFWKRRSVLKQFEVEKNIREEKKRSEDLLLNILPPKIMAELRDTGKSNPEYFENTTVLFAEIENFDELNSQMQAEELVQIINDVYEEFDSIIEKNNCVRIKTTGSIYMAVCGLPEANEKHAENMIFCAKQILSFVEKYNQTSKEKIKIKIGLNSGKVIAGIVGIRKYIYDIFGDTVNTASRMETSSRAMEINVSEHTYQLVKEKFNFIKQDAVQVKGKGLMQTYYLDDK